MHQLRSLRRLALGAALAGAALGAAPALASAAGPTCLYNPTTRQITVDDPGTGGRPLVVLRTGDNIAISDTIGPTQICTNQVDFFTVAATVSNTDHITINSNNQGFARFITLQQLGPGATHESDGVSEIETLINTTNPVSLQLLGSSGPDGFRVGATGINFGLDLLASDNDIDVQWTTPPTSIAIDGLAGDDAISGQGNFANPRPTDVRLTLDGGLGNDFVEGGLGGDYLIGGLGDDPTGNDRLVSNDGHLDTLFGGPGFDTAATDANEQSVKGIEVRTVASVGQLRLAPHALRARAGGAARLTLGWKHPQGWRKLRTLELSLHRGKDTVGMINARPASGRLAATGAVHLAPGSGLAHHGKWVTAKLALRVAKSLAGADLRVDVRATDTHGRTQVERGAGSIHLTK